MLPSWYIQNVATAATTTTASIVVPVFLVRLSPSSAQFAVASHQLRICSIERTRNFFRHCSVSRVIEKKQPSSRVLVLFKEEFVEFVDREKVDPSFETEFFGSEPQCRFRATFRSSVFFFFFFFF